MIKFKVGDKVRIKQWLDMPEELKYNYGMNTYGIGYVGIVDKFVEQTKNVNGYDIILNIDHFLDKGANRHHFAFEPELEPFVKVGEQLLLFDL